MQQVIDDSAKVHMLIKTKRGEKEEKFSVEVHKSNEGGLRLNHMAPDNSWFTILTWEMNSVDLMTYQTYIFCVQ